MATVAARSESRSKTGMNFGGWGWGVIFFSMLMYFNYVGWSADGLNIFTTAFGKEHGWDPAVLLSLATPGGLMGVVGAFVFGQIIMKKGPRFVTTVCLAFAGLSVIWFGRISSLPEFAVAFAAIGFFGSGFGFIAPGTLITNWFPTKKGIALGWATMGMPAATALFVPLIAFLFSSLGIANAAALYGIIMIALAVFAFFFVKDFPEQIGCCPDNETISQDEIQANLKEIEGYESPFTLKRLMKDREMWLTSLGFGCLWMVTLGIVVQLVPRLMSIGFDQQTAILLLASAAVCALPGSVLWGWLDQKYGTKPAGMLYACWYVLTLILLIAQTRNTALTFATVVSVGIGLGGIKNLITSMIGSVYGRYDFTAANRIIIPISIIVRTLGFAVMGIAMASTNGFSGAYAAFIAVDIIGLILIFFISPVCKGKLAAT